MPRVADDPGKIGTGQTWADAMDALALHWRSQAPERRQGRSRRRSEEILQAALRVFSREGIARARIADIAAEAGIPLSSLYEYYPSKRDIAYAVPLTHLARFFIEYAERARDTETARARLRLFLWFSADYARRHPDWARTLYLEIWPSVLVGDSPARKILDDYGRFVVRLVRMGAAAGEWSAAHDPYETASILVGSHNQVVITWLLYRKPHDIMRAIGAMLDRLLTAVLPPDAGTAAPPPPDAGTAALSAPTRAEAPPPQGRRGGGPTARTVRTTGGRQRNENA